MCEGDVTEQQHFKGTHPIIHKNLYYFMPDPEFPHKDTLCATYFMCSILLLFDVYVLLERV